VSEPEAFRILIVDDEPNIRSGLARGLAEEGTQIQSAADGREAVELLQSESFQLMVADLRLPGEITGLDLVSLARQEQSQIASIVITSHGNVEAAVEAMRRGALDFLSKPVDLNVIRLFVQKAKERHRLLVENLALKERLAEAGEITGMVASSPEMQSLFQLIRQVATTDATVLIHGESGTGKELIARAIHDLSPRSGNRFVPVALGALPETLLESELFGYEKGAFSGAARQKPGCFELANGGTLFLDEVTEMSPKSQVDLLRVLETREVVRLGGERPLFADARIVAATNRDMDRLVREGQFREDLYYRLNVVPVEVPPLRQRREDIPLLIEHFLTIFGGRYDRPARSLSAEAMDLLQNYDWPGNIRQLRNLMERLSVTAKGEEISADMVPQEIQARQTVRSSRTLASVVEQAEMAAIQSALAECDNHRERTAKLLDISVRTLHYKMNRYGLY
jgi:two-component system NtrC family response regulator